MNLTFDLRELAAEVFADICEKYHLSITSISGDLVLMIGEKYFILIGVDYDGVYMNYFNKNEFTGFDLISYLLDNRRRKLTFSPEDPLINTHRGYIKSHLEALARHLNMGGTDILKGEITWQDDYRSPRVLLPEVKLPQAEKTVFKR